MKHNGLFRYRVPASSFLVPILVLLLAGCQGGAQSDPAEVPEDNAPCQPSCEGRQCGDDGCGGQCGLCAADFSCSPQGKCVEEVGGSCDSTCGDLGLECGMHCGESCGTCAGQDLCVAGKCLCAPACTAAECGQPDGCGGMCGPCPSAESCAECGWRLSVVDQLILDDFVTEVTLALDFAPTAEAPLPGMADVRFKVSGPAELLSVGVGPPVSAAEKQPHISAETGQPFTVLANGVHQILLFSTANTNTIGEGRWLLLKFRFRTEQGPLGLPWLYEPLVVTMAKRDGVFAPPPADIALWSVDYEGSVVVWPEVMP